MTGFEPVLAVHGTKLCLQLSSVEHWEGLDGVAQRMLRKCLLVLLKHVPLQQGGTDKVVCEGEASHTHREKKKTRRDDKMVILPTVHHLELPTGNCSISKYGTTEVIFTPTVTFYEAK